MRAFALLALAPFAATRSPRQRHPEALIPNGRQSTVEASSLTPLASPKTGVHTPPAATPGAAEDLVRRWEGRACRNVFAASLDTARPKFDPASGMLVPEAARDLRRTSKTSGSELDEIGVRHVTWEDTLDRRNISIRAGGRPIARRSTRDLPRASALLRACGRASVRWVVDSPAAGDLPSPKPLTVHRAHREVGECLDQILVWVPLAAPLPTHDGTPALRQHGKLYGL